MKNQAFNPYLPSFEYIPDAEPHVFDGRVYIYGSHDKYNGISFCLNDYVTWSAPIDDLSDWRFEGYIWHRSDDPKTYHSFLNSLFAPDICKGKDGRYYLYYFIGYNSLISVAVSDRPNGPFKFLSHIKYKDGTNIGTKKEPLQFDPGVFVDDDGKVYLYTGFGPKSASPFMIGKKPTSEGSMCFELEDDMYTIKDGFTYIGVPAINGAKGTKYEGHEFFEASSMRKINGRYYFIYSSFLGHELCYAIGSSPKGPFEFGGTLVSIGDIGINGHTNPKNASNYTGNTHGSLIEINGKYYVFYHRQTNRHQFSRQACAEEVFIDETGHIKQVETTSCGLNGGPLSGKGTYEARIACVLKNPSGNRFYGISKGPKGSEPFFTQVGSDREDNPDQYVANIRKGVLVGYRYFNLKDTSSITLKLRGKANGCVNIYSDEEKKNLIGKIEIQCKTSAYSVFKGELKHNSNKSGLYLSFDINGHVDFKSFTLE